jgi:hypothetical protein
VPLFRTVEVSNGLAISPADGNATGRPIVDITIVGGHVALAEGRVTGLDEREAEHLRDALNEALER